MMTSRRRLRRIFRSLDASEVERTKRRKEQVRTAAVIHRLRTHFAIIPVRRHNMRWDADPACQALQRAANAELEFTCVKKLHGSKQIKGRALKAMLTFLEETGIMFLLVFTKEPMSLNCFKSQGNGSVLKTIADIPNELILSFETGKDFMDVFVPEECLKDNIALFKAYLESRAKPLHEQPGSFVFPSTESVGRGPLYRYRSSCLDLDFDFDCPAPAAAAGDADCVLCSAVPEPRSEKSTDPRQKSHISSPTARGTTQELMSRLKTCAASRATHLVSLASTAAFAVPEQPHTTQLFRRLLRSRGHLSRLP
ncbi:hypothetical protein HPB47_016366 [Ixodes persulcatus]|uniref:Uncharacterized protein n=1 Tax=Ixodes persulcatus TaxID=34615 RepID=A0AC60QUN1_IXOPE|nr:hypothetical protein HPB47_016366 [Ixodes persulcatus]